MILCDTVLEWPRNEQVCQLDTWFFTYWYWWYCMFVIVSPFLGGHWIAIALTELQVLWMHPLGCDPACDIGPGGVAGNGEYGRIRIWHLETCECMMLRSWFLTALDFLKGFWFGLFVCQYFHLYRSFSPLLLDKRARYVVHSLARGLACS